MVVVLPVLCGLIRRPPLTNFSVSFILNVKFILFFTIFSLTVADIASNCSSIDTLSISSRISFTAFIEYGSPLSSFSNFNNLLKLFLSKSIGVCSFKSPK